MAIEEQQSASLKELLTVLFKYKYGVITFLVLAVAMMAVISLVSPPVYEAESTLLIKFGREYASSPEVLNTNSPVVSVSLEEAVNSEINIMRSRDLIQKVVTTLGIRQLYPQLAHNPPSGMTALEAAIIKFNRDLTVEVIKKSNVLQVSFRHPNPEIAAKAVNLLVESHKEKHFQVYNAPEFIFLGKELSTFDQKLKESEKAVQRYKQINGVYSLDEQRALLLKQRTELDVALKDSRSRIEGIQRRLSSVNSRMQQMAGARNSYVQTERDNIIVQAQSHLLDRQLKEQDLLAKYPEKNLLVAKVRKEMGIVSDFLDRQEENITSKVRSSSPVYQEAEKQALLADADLRFEVARERVQRAQLRELDGQIQSLDLKEKELQALKRDVATNDKSYRAYLERFVEARISSEMNLQKFANVSVIQVATPPAKPASRNKVVMFLISVILGAASGVGYAFLRNHVSQALSTPESAERRLGLPVLATVEVKR